MKFHNKYILSGLYFGSLFFFGEVSYEVNLSAHQSVSTTPPSSPRNPGAFDRRLNPGDGEFEPRLAGVGNLNQKFRVFPVEYKFYMSLT